MSGKQMVCVLYSGKEHKNTGVWGHLAWPTQPNLVTKLWTQTKADPKFCQRVYFMHHYLLTIKSFYWVSIAGEFYCLKKSNSLDQMRLEQDLGGDGGVEVCLLWCLLLLPRESDGVLSISSDLDTLWTEPRWEHLSAWPGTWSPGEQPSRSHICTTEIAWPQRMGRLVPRYACLGAMGMVEGLRAPTPAKDQPFPHRIMLVSNEGDLWVHG